MLKNIKPDRIYVIVAVCKDDQDYFSVNFLVDASNEIEAGKYFTEWIEPAMEEEIVQVRCMKLTKFDVYFAGGKR